MVVLTLFPSKKTFKYRNKTQALDEVRSNGLKGFQYFLVDKSDNTVYMKGLWIKPDEYKLLENGSPISYIKIRRKRMKRGLK